MVRSLRLGSAAAVLAAAAWLPVPAHAASSADCPYTQVNGQMTYGQPITTTYTSTTWTMSLSMNCFGTAPSAGSYNLLLTGLTTERCDDGTATGNITGTGPLGAVTGTTGYQKLATVHYYGFPPYATSTFTSGGKSFTLALWLDRGTYVLGTSIFVPDTTCPFVTTTIVGHAAVYEV